MRRTALSRIAWAALLLCPSPGLAEARAGSLPAAPIEPAPKAEKKPKAQPDERPSKPAPAASPDDRPSKPAPAASAKAETKAPPPRASESRPAAEPKALPKAEPTPPPAKPSSKGAKPGAPDAPSAPGGPSNDKPTAPRREIDATTAPKPATDVARGSGQRSVTPSTPVGPSDVAPLPSKGSAAPEPRVSHQKGRPPAKPSATLPAGAARRTPDESARQHITGGLPTDDEVRRGKEDAELRSLREAERILFPHPLRGVELGFDFAVASAAGPEVNATGLPAGVSSGTSFPASSSSAWLHALASPDLPVRYDERVVRYLHFYKDTPSGKAVARAWAKKAGRFGAAIKAELKRAGLPMDLLWLSVIESSHNPTISSPAGAAGLWQFMPDAARSYGLTVDRWVDERLDPERSTQAAIRYLSDLYRRFGSWELSMAAYNMGYGGLSRSVRKYSTNSFWELCRYEAGIPWETTLYVPKILATAVVMSNRRAFGLDGVIEDEPERFDVVVVGPSVPLSELARAVGKPTTEIESLNPQLLAGRTPPAAPGAPRNSYRVRVPLGSGKSFTPAQLAFDDDLETYVVRTGETVERIARARGTSERALREKNRVGPNEILQAGTVLLVPKVFRDSEPEPTTEEALVVVPARSPDYPGRRRVFYRVVTGDTAPGVAAAFRVAPRDLADWNTLDVQARLEPGMSLQVFVGKDTDLSKVLHVPEAHAKILVAGSPEFSDYFENQNGKRRLVIAARDGDTMTTIGKRYGMTIGQMERVNRRGRTDPLKVGQRVVVYTERAQPAPGDRLLASN
jgi:membrane-bound lytic murein transglycosylase D